MEGSSKRSVGAASGLPDDLLVEILSRVPAKSVCRFKCLSRAWRDLIADPDIRKKLRQPMQGLFVHDDDESDDDESDDDELGRFNFSFIDLTQTVGSVPLDIDSCFPFLAEMTGSETFFLDSFNGLILFGQRQEPSHELDGYIVCNPTTRQWSAMPAPCCSHEATSHTNLAFNPAVSSHFHLVQFQTLDVGDVVVSLHVYSSETGTWSQNQIYDQKEQGYLEGWHHQFTLDATEQQFSFVNGFLHLIVLDSDDVQHILAVDVQGKDMTEGMHGHSFDNCYLGQSQGHLHCMTQESTDEKNVKLSTWVLQDYDTQKWVLKNTVNSVDVFGETRVMPEFRVVDIHQDCNVVFFFDPWTWRHELIAYDMDRKEVNVIATFEGDKDRSHFARYIPCFLESPALINKY